MDADWRSAEERPRIARMDADRSWQVKAPLSNHDLERGVLSPFPMPSAFIRAIRGCSCSSHRDGLRSSAYVCGPFTNGDPAQRVITPHAIRGPALPLGAVR